MFQAGLILEGGGMRGVFTAGVLDFFLEQEVSFQMVFGVSAGACHACSYLSGQKGRAYHVAVDYLKDKRYCSFYSLLTTGDLFGEEMVYHLIPEKLTPYDYDAFSRNPTEFYAVATDCETGAPAYLRVQDMRRDIDMIRASSSLPLLARIVEIGGQKLLDGGMADSIPLRAAEDKGSAKNVVVLTQPREFKKQPNKMLPLLRWRYRAYPKLIDSIASRHWRYNETLDYIRAQEEKGDVFVIAPTEDLSIGRIEKNKQKLEHIYWMGYHQAEKQYSALQSFLQQ